MIYFAQNTATRHIKIGFSLKDPKGRVASLQTGSVHKLKLILVIEGDVRAEKAIHRLFDKCRINGEWFECSKELTDYIEEQQVNSILDELDEIKLRMEKAEKQRYSDALELGKNNTWQQSYKKVKRYNDKDYDTEFSLKKGERELILIAAMRFKGDLGKMAEHIGITTRSLQDRLVAHSLNGLDLAMLY